MKVEFLAIHSPARSLKYARRYFQLYQKLRKQNGLSAHVVIDLGRSQNLVNAPTEATEELKFEIEKGILERVAADDVQSPR